MRIFCKVDGRDGIIVGSGPGYKRVKDKFEPRTVLLVILQGADHISAVHLDEAQLYGTPKRLRKLHKKLLKRSASATE